MGRLNVVAFGWTGLYHCESEGGGCFTDLFTGSYVQQIRR